MANCKLVGNWSKEYQKNVSKGFLLLKVDDKFYKKTGKFLNKLNEFQEKKNELRELDITITYHYQKRTIDQNNLMWALYEIQANEMNAGQKGDSLQNITSEELYENDLLEYGPKIKLLVENDMVNMFKSQYKIIKQEDYNENIKILTAILTTSKFNTKQMAEWIDRIFNRLAFNGIEVTSPEEIHTYWQKWRNHLNSQKIILHEKKLTGEEYKKANPICEATGKYIGDGSGHLCHIKSRGMGGNQEDYKDTPANWLHLCHEAHIEIQHQKGWSHFLKLFPHLSNKINQSLNKTIDDIKKIFQGEEIDTNNN